MQDHNSIVQALLFERSGYERRGLHDRVAQVDAVLESLGVEIETSSIEPQTETATRKKPLRRKKG